MSRREEFIKVECKHSLVRRELIVSTGHVCPECQGNGWFWGMDEEMGRMKIECKNCNGTGELDALVTIDWRAHKEN